MRLPRFLAVIVCAILAAGCTGTGSNTGNRNEKSLVAPAVTPPKSTPRLGPLNTEPCQISQMTVSMSIAMPAGTHSYLTETRLSNSGPSPCSIRGYPSVTISRADDLNLPLKWSRAPAETSRDLSELRQLVGRRGAPTLSHVWINLQSGDYAAFFVNTRTGNGCDVRNQGYNSTWHIHGPDGAGSVTLLHIDTQVCAATYAYITPLMPPGPAATPHLPEPIRRP